MNKDQGLINRYIKAWVRKHVNLFDVILLHVVIIKYARNNRWLMFKRTFPKIKQEAGWKRNFWTQAWRFEGRIISSLREHQWEKLRIQLYFAKVTFPGPKQEVGWKINSWTQARRHEGNYERVCDINGKT